MKNAMNMATSLPMLLWALLVVQVTDAFCPIPTGRPLFLNPLLHSQKMCVRPPLGMLSLAAVDGDFVKAQDGEALQTLFAKQCDDDGLMTMDTLKKVPAIAELLVSCCYLFIHSLRPRKKKHLLQNYSATKCRILLYPKRGCCYSEWYYCIPFCCNSHYSSLFLCSPHLSTTAICWWMS